MSTDLARPIPIRPNTFKHEDVDSLTCDGLSIHHSAHPNIPPHDVQSTSPAGSITSESFLNSPLDVKSELDDSDQGPARSPGDHRSLDSDQTVTVAVDPPPKRKRGRPRKHPIVVQSPEDKIRRGRSKTGCITCRRRKKKCDETKPECLNCQKNLATCEGYPIPKTWQGGRARSDARRLSDLPAIIDGVENEEDRMLLEHFQQNLGHVLCLACGLDKTKKSPFIDIIVPMCHQDAGLMHSILCISGYQLACESVKSQVPEPSRERVAARSDYHWDQASKNLMRKVKELRQISQPDQTAPVYDNLVAHALLLCLKTVIAGDRFGEYKVHLNGAQRLILEHDYFSRSSAFHAFASEFILYHRAISNLTSLDRSCSLSISMYQRYCQQQSSNNFKLPSFVDSAAGAFLGVLDGLFIIISKITVIRDRARERFIAGRPAVPPPEATAVLEELRNWEPAHAQVKGSARHTTSLLYRVATWIYLRRSCTSSASPALQDKIDEGLHHLHSVIANESMQPVLLTPIFLLGVGAFDSCQRQIIDDAFGTLQRARGCGNIKWTRLAVQHVWGLMDAQDPSSWDWESVMAHMPPGGVDFLLA